MGHKKDICPLCGKLKDIRSKRCIRKHKTQEEILQKRRKWVETNKEKIRATQRRYKKRHLEKCQERTRKHRKENPEAYRLNQKRYIRKRRKWLQAYKHTVGCKLCPENDPRCLDFHHRDSATKKFKIAGLPCSLEKLKEEIKKCDVICANCHRKKTWKRRDI